METQANKPKPKRLPKGQRKHVRRMKQAARKDGTVYTSSKVNRN